jgi:nucleoside-diphosphate-sugar epimerase
LRIAVVGATGHIGTWLVPRFVRGGHDVVAISRGQREPYHDSPEWSDVQRLSIDRARADADGWFGPAMASLEADVIVDLICFDADSAMHIVESLRGSVGHFVHCGTLWVHGVPRVRPYDETAPREPFGAYGIRKAEIERYLLEQSRSGFPATVLHPGHITGPGWNPINPAGNLDAGIFEKLAAGDEVTLPDEGMATLQHVHADDVAQAFELAVARPDAAIGEAFHVAAREPVTMRDYAEAVASWSGRSADLRFLPWEEWKMTVTERDAEITLDHVRHSPHASIAKAESRLGYQPLFSATEAVRSALRTGK